MQLLYKAMYIKWYTVDWVIICYLPPFTSTRKFHWKRKARLCHSGLSLRTLAPHDNDDIWLVIHLDFWRICESETELLIVLLVSRVRSCWFEIWVPTHPCNPFLLWWLPGMSQTMMLAVISSPTVESHGTNRSTDTCCFKHCPISCQCFAGKDFIFSVRHAFSLCDLRSTMIK